MLKLSSSQKALINSDTKRVAWLFDITASSSEYTIWGESDDVVWGESDDVVWGIDENASTDANKWSTISYTQNYGAILWESGVSWETGVQWELESSDYDFKIISANFNGLDFKGGSPGYGVAYQSKLNFVVSNKNNALDPDTFIEGNVQVTLVLSDANNTEDIVKWKYKILRCESINQKLYFTCEDFLQQYLEGDYPSTPLISSIDNTTTYGETNKNCVPIIFGTSYVPLTPVLSGTSMLYILGLAASGSTTYTITKVSSPVKTGAGVTEYLATDYNLLQTTRSIGGSSLAVFEPIIADSDGDGVVDSVGLWSGGNTYSNMPTKYSRSDTSSTTNAADIIKYVLEDMGVSSNDIDTVSFNAAADTFDDWELSFEGGYYEKNTKRKVLSSLLAQCNSTLVLTDKVGISVNQKTSVKTITKSLVNRGKQLGESSFKYNPQQFIKTDAAYIGFVPTDTPQVSVNNIIISPSGTSKYISREILPTPFINNSIQAQRIGQLYYQRKLWPSGNVSFEGKSKLLSIQPGDTITINDVDYGGNFNVVVDSVRIGRDLKTSFGCTKFRYALEDYNDTTPAAITITTNPVATTFTPVVSGEIQTNPLILESQSTGISKLILDGSVTPPLATFHLPSGILQPNDHFTTDLGTNTQAFDEAYADNWNNVADFYYMDTLDDLGLINSITSSGITDSKTGFEYIDDNTIPKQLLVKDDEGSILRDPSGKPYLSNRVLFSLLMGSIKQLQEKLKLKKDKDNI